MATEAGWYDDPTSKAELRYWDGTGWTERTRSRPPAEDSDEPTARTRAQAKATRPRSEICVVSWTWTDQRSQDRRTRKDFPYEIWFVANALGPNGLYRAQEGTVTFYSGTNSYYHSGIVVPSGQSSNQDHFNQYRVLPRDEYSEASFNDLVKRLWADGWEPASGGGRSSLWYEYRFRRTVMD